jgi:hypothetical protein
MGMSQFLRISHSQISLWTVTIHLMQTITDFPRYAHNTLGVNCLESRIRLHEHLSSVSQGSHTLLEAVTDVAWDCWNTVKMNSDRSLWECRNTFIDLTYRSRLGRQNIFIETDIDLS